MLTSNELSAGILIALLILAGMTARGQDIEYVSTCFPRWANVGQTVNGLVYLTANDSLYILDIADPRFPAMIGMCDSAGGNCAVVGEYAYLAKGMCDEEYLGKYLRIVNVADPSHPVRVSSFIPMECPTGIALVDGYALMSEFDPFLLDGWLEVVRVDDPQNPRRVASRRLSGFPTCLHLHSNMAFVGLGYEEPYYGQILIFDIGNPIVPLQIGSCDIPEWPQNIHSADNYLFVADGFSGLRIIDFTDPADPREAAKINMPSFSMDVVVDKPLALVAAEATGLQAVDVVDPTDPWLAQIYPMPGFTLGIFAADDLIFLSNTDSVVILRLSTSSAESSPRLPGDFQLFPNYPNPFNARTTIRFSMPEAGPVGIDIYDILGRKIGAAFSGILQAGEQSAVWDAGGNPSGIYFCRMAVGGRVIVGKMTLTK